MMNKEQIITAFYKAHNENGLKAKETAEKLGIHVCYINSLCNNKRWDTIGPKALGAMLSFLNSGKELNDYHYSRDFVEHKVSRKKMGRKVKAIKPKSAPMSQIKPINPLTVDRLAEKLTQAMKEASFDNFDTARKLGITPEAIALLKNERLRISCPQKTLIAVERFLNSGQSLKDYHYLKPVVEIRGRKSELVTPDKTTMVYDIEINLTINGKRVEL